MKDKEIKLSNKYEEFYPKNYPRKNNFANKEKESKETNSNSKNKNVTFKEYVPQKRMLNQQIHPLEKNKESFYPKHKSKFSKEKSIKKEEKKERDSIEDEDDYSGLAGNNNKNYNMPKWKNYRRSEDRNDFKTKWKTEMCHYWEMYGFCKYGDSCAFAHGSDELNKRKMSSNYKTKPCKQFFELGYCSYGVRCQFSHKLLKECEDKRNDEPKEEVSYLKILSDFNNSSNQISHEILKRPRLMTFENIASCTLGEKEKNRLELYEDIIAVKKKESEEPEHVFSDDTNDENSENTGKNENNDKEEKNENNNKEDVKENEKNKRERFISI